MYAIVRRYEPNPIRLARAHSALSEVDALHQAQPGYAGSLVIDDGRYWTVVNLWDSQEAADAGRSVIGPVVQRLLAPLATGTPELLAAGEVSRDVIAKARLAIQAEPSSCSA